MNSELPVTLELRRNDYTLSEEQVELRQAVRDLFAKHSPMETVRRSEPLGFDEALWEILGRNGVLGLGLSEDLGGEGGGVVELSLVGMEAGRALAPAPLIDHLVALRLLAAVRDAGIDVPVDWESARVGSSLLSLAPISEWTLGRELVPGGAVASSVFAFKDENLIVLSRSERAPQATNPGGAPLAWWDPRDPSVDTTAVVGGPTAKRLWSHAVQEWKVGTAAMLVGLAEGASEIARQYALEREAFGVPIAKFQAISHALVDLYIDTTTARNLTLKAAWMTEHEPGFRPELPAMALAHAADIAVRGVANGLHVHGGFGITLEADISVYYRRAAAWASVAGGSGRLVDEVAASIERHLEARSQRPAAAPAGA